MPQRRDWTRQRFREGSELLRGCFTSISYLKQFDCSLCHKNRRQLARHLVLVHHNQDKIRVCAFFATILLLNKSKPRNGSRCTVNTYFHLDKNKHEQKIQLEFGTVKISLGIQYGEKIGKRYLLLSCSDEYMNCAS